MESLGNLISQKNTLAPLMQKIDSSLILEKFNQIMIAEFGVIAEKKAKSLYLKNDCLYVAALSSVLSQEIKLREGKLVEMLNVACDRDVVESLKIM